MTERIEKVIFENLLGADEYTRKVLHHLKPEYFESHVDRVLIKEIKRFYAEHNTVPTKKILKLFIEDCGKFKQDEYKKATETIDSLGDIELNTKWLIDRTEQFCSEKAVYNAITESIGILNGENTKFTKTAIPSLLQEALSVSFDKTIGHDYFNDIEERFKFYHLKEDRIPFGLAMFNKITKGGIPRKTLSAILAPTGVGKSLFLCDHAAKSLSAGWNCLYITLEMAEQRIAERIDCNLLDISVDDLHRLRHDDFDDKISTIRDKTKGKLVVKEYPTSSAHVGHFKALLDELRLKKNFVPDIVYVDYINICASQRYKPGANWNSYFAIKAIAEELRGMAVENNIAVFTATQTNRGGVNNSDIEMTDTSESMGLPMSLDLLFAMIRSEELDNLGQLMIKQLKNRFNDINFYKRFIVGIDISKFKLYDVDVDPRQITDPGKTDNPKPSFTSSRKSLNVDDVNFE